MDYQSLFEKLVKEKKYPCLSIWFPTHTTAPENYQDPVVLKNLAHAARERLLAEFDEREVKTILDNLEQVQGDIDHQKNKESMGIFLNESVCEITRLPIKVEARVSIDPNFATRPILEAQSGNPSYYIITLSESHIHLFEATGDHAHELHDGGFPIANKHHHVSHKMRSDWTKEEDHAVQEFFAEVDKKFDAVYKANPLPLVVAGGGHALDNFREVTTHQKAILTEIHGNYDHTSAEKLGDIAWPQVVAATSRQMLAELDRFGEAVGANKVATGLAEVFATAKEGRGETLLIEKDFFHPAKIVDGHLELAVNAGDPGVMDDIVDEIAELVVSMGGRATFVEPGMMQSFGTRIGMILRF